MNESVRSLRSGVVIDLMDDQFNEDEIPRSVRWRIQMGLFELQPDANVTLREVENYNCDAIESARNDFEQLRASYRSELIAAEAAEATEELNASLRSGEMKKSGIDNDEIAKDDATLSVTESKPDENEIDDDALLGAPFYGSDDCYDESDGSILLLDFGHRLEEEEQEQIMTCERTLSLINKDLHRLQPDHNLPNSPLATQDRCRLIREMLYYHSREHPQDYQQGQHELASILFMVVEMDALQYHDSSTTANLADHRHLLFNPNFVAHDAYILFRELLIKIQPAYYDGHNIKVLSKLKYVCNNHALEKHLLNEVEMISEELLFCRWMRLMLSREVEHVQDILPLWDLFWDLTSEASAGNILSLGHPRKYTSPNSTPVNCRQMELDDSFRSNLCFLHLDAAQITPQTFTKVRATRRRRRRRTANFSNI